MAVEENDENNGIEINKKKKYTCIFCKSYCHITLTQVRAHTYWEQRVHFINTLRPRQNGQHFPDNIFKHIVFNENVWISIKISLKFLPKGPINNVPALVQIMAWRWSGNKPLSEPMMVSFLTHICVTRPQWVKRCWGYSLCTQTACLSIRIHIIIIKAAHWCQAITWTNVDLLPIWCLGTKFKDIFIEIKIFSFNKMYCKDVICKMVAFLFRPHAQYKHKLTKVHIQVE